MTRRDLMKTAAAVVALPATLLSRASEAIAARRADWAEMGAPVPIPAYTYESRSRRMTLYAADESTRAMQSYLRRF